jgi:hypothetical protein
MNDNTPNISELAVKTRHLTLLQKVKDGKRLSKAELRELQRYDAQNKTPTETVGQQKKKAGRKSKYNPDNNKIIKSLCGRGITDKQLCLFFNIDEKTLNNWKHQFPIFFQSLKTGKALADAKVEACLFQRAIGYSVPDVHISSYEGEITITPIIKHFPPDVTAQIFWLKNRKPKQWRDRQELEHSGEIGGYGVLAVPIGMSKDKWLQYIKQKQSQDKKT